jgi:hypothetical protein
LPWLPFRLGHQLLDELEITAQASPAFQLPRGMQQKLATGKHRERDKDKHGFRKHHLKRGYRTAGIADQASP